jgi:hypothetical protein
MLQSCKSDEMIDFLEVVRTQNPERPLCIVVDNAAFACKSC